EGQREIDLRLIPAPYRDTCIEFLTTLARPDHPAVVAAGVVLRGRPPPVRVIYDHYLRLRVIAEWGLARDLLDFSHWTQRDADQLLDDLIAGRHRDNGIGLAPSSRRGYIDTLKGLRECSPMLEHGLGFMPWGARTAAHVAGLTSRPVEHLPAPLPWS